MRSMETLIDANHGLSQDLPLAYLRRLHWLEAGNSLVEAWRHGQQPLAVISERTCFSSGSC